VDLLFDDLVKYLSETINRSQQNSQQQTKQLLQSNHHQSSNPLHPHYPHHPHTIQSKEEGKTELSSQSSAQPQSSPQPQQQQSSPPDEGQQHIYRVDSIDSDRMHTATMKDHPSYLQAQLLSRKLLYVNWIDVLERDRDERVPTILKLTNALSMHAR
jgi:hypothetical protein